MKTARNPLETARHHLETTRLSRDCQTLWRLSDSLGTVRLSGDCQTLWRMSDSLETAIDSLERVETRLFGDCHVLLS